MALKAGFPQAVCPAPFIQYVDRKVKVLMYCHCSDLCTFRLAE